MSKDAAKSLGKWVAIIGILAGAVTVIGWAAPTAGRIVDISRTPEREAALEQRVDTLARNCETNFLMLHAELRAINTKLK